MGFSPPLNGCHKSGFNALIIKKKINETKNNNSKVNINFHFDLIKFIRVSLCFISMKKEKNITDIKHRYIGNREKDKKLRLVSNQTNNPFINRPIGFVNMYPLSDNELKE